MFIVWADRNLPRVFDELLTELSKKEVAALHSLISGPVTDRSGHIVLYCEKAEKGSKIMNGPAVFEPVHWCSETGC
jgi:hypothetical protein